ncbi:helix-turn-helix domain-containing protein [Pseudoxanthomonas daejeonensis]|uniref:helix-turn-helix domain-containing protein n=1 Tax=Pseudoxanthomonas daejeonensis TaxID=266062 RepID=UPI001F5423A5|nr:helix-turn-helix transcriptional regulator [Pseudoxanthomonas daejeonensis]UNK57471.1 helix-turn-helix domain-containing protein [Pseudoxanthomonas daejeonensis]
MPRQTDIRLVFQRRLKQARQGHQLSQKELGIRTGLDAFVASTRINRYEQGVHEPDMAMVERMAVALDVPTAYLLTTDDRLARMILAFDRLPTAKKDDLLRMLESDNS